MQIKILLVNSLIGLNLDKLRAIGYQFTEVKDWHTLANKNGNIVSDARSEDIDWELTVARFDIIFLDNGEPYEARRSIFNTFKEAGLELAQYQLEQYYVGIKQRLKDNPNFDVQAIMFD